MLDAIRSYFRAELASPPQSETPESEADRLRMAACALLVELAWADGSFDEEERTHLNASLTQRMGLTPGQADRLVALADAQRQQATDYYQFTSLVAEQFSPYEKHMLLEMMWELVRADGTISRGEDHLIRRVAPLLGLDSRSVADAKARVESRS